MQQSDIGIQFFGGDEASGNVFVVETKAKAGWELMSHKHEHAHLSILVSGVVDLTIGGMTERVQGYRILTIPAGVQHNIVAVTDVVWLCLWDAANAPREAAEESLKLVDAGCLTSACAQCPGQCSSN